MFELKRLWRLFIFKKTLNLNYDKTHLLCCLTLFMAAVTEEPGSIYALNPPSGKENA